MADELGKGFIFVAVLLFTFAFFVSILPPGLLGEVDPDTYYRHNVPDNWIGEEISTWGEIFTNSNNMTLEKGSGEHNLSVGDELLRMSFIELDDRDPLYIWHVWFPALAQRHPMEPYPLERDTVMERRLGTAEPERARINMFCDHYTYFVSVSYNDTKFDTLDEAYDGNETYNAELWIFVGMNWESEVGSINAWSVIGQLLLFQSPDIHPAINVLIAFPIWAGIIYLAYRFIMMAIPFLGG